jgi:cystathionine beta-lyase
VFYPGRPTHPGHAIAKSQMTGFGPVLSFELPGDAEAFQRRLKLIRSAVSLGGVETTICSPARTSHAKMPRADRERLGITDALLRLSVGVEHADDLIADLAQALGADASLFHEKMCHSELARNLTLASGGSRDSSLRSE